MILLDCYDKEGNAALIIGLTMEEARDYTSSDEGLSVDLEKDLPGVSPRQISFVFAEDDDAVKEKLKRMGVPVDDIPDASTVSVN